MVKVNLAYHAIADVDGELLAHGRGGPDPTPCRAPRGAEPARADRVGRLRVGSSTRRVPSARKARRCSDERDLEVPCPTRPCGTGPYCAIGPGEYPAHRQAHARSSRVAVPARRPPLTSASVSPRAAAGDASVRSGMPVRCMPQAAGRSARVPVGELLYDKQTPILDCAALLCAQVLSPLT